MILSQYCCSVQIAILGGKTLQPGHACARLGFRTRCHIGVAVVGEVAAALIMVMLLPMSVLALVSPPAPGLSSSSCGGGPGLFMFQPAHTLPFFPCILVSQCLVEPCGLCCMPCSCGAAMSCSFRWHGCSPLAPSPCHHHCMFKFPLVVVFLIVLPGFNPLVTQKTRIVMLACATIRHCQTS